MMCQKYTADLKKCPTAPQSFSALQHSELHISPGTHDVIESVDFAFGWWLQF